jgi:very-long-chain enoyl-CoA reductase
MLFQFQQLPILQGVLGAIISALQLLSFGSYWNEVEEKTRTPYSKFATIKDKQVTTVPSRIGMLVIYTPALVVCYALTFVAPVERFSLAGLLCFLSFLKRDVEVLFVHKYSGTMPLSSATSIALIYSMYSLLVCCVATPKPSEIYRILGTGVFTVGILGNGYHHILLANLRSTTSTSTNAASKKYVAPRGGLFKYVAAPHYLFELITWFGVAVSSQHLNVFFIFITMTSYLAGRSVAQNRWNRQKFSEKEWPACRRNLIPFLW